MTEQLRPVHRSRIAATSGTPLGQAKAAMIMIHGRGDSAPGILQLAQAIQRPAFAYPGLAYVAPQATNNTWYPNSFLAPLESNEPWLSSALDAVGGVLEQVIESGVAKERTVLLGFSQGACLASEFAARNGGRFAGVVALSGGLIGPDVATRSYAGDLAGTPAFLGCSDVDAHIPVERVHESARVLERLGATVEKRIYPRMGHTVNQDEVDYVRRLLDGILD